MLLSLALGCVLLTPSALAVDAAGGVAEVERFDEERQDDTGSPTPPSLESPQLLSQREIAMREALERGLAFLAREQAKAIDGSFPKGDAREWAPVGVTALGCLAFLAGGHQPGRGPYGKNTQRALDYLLSKADRNPNSKTYGYIGSEGDRHSRIHGHGYATLALAEALGMSPGNENLRGVLTQAVDRIQKSQSSEGGWGYEPIPGSFHEGSTTICVVQALRAARNAGVVVDSEIIARAVDYVSRLQAPDGTFRYQLHSEDTSVALTAAGIATLNMAGTYDAAPIQAGIDAIWRLFGTERPMKFPDYERLYLAQAFWQLTDRTHFDAWWPGELRRILSSQRADGSWSSPAYGPAYATAVQCLVLAMPDGLLPIFQR